MHELEDCRSIVASSVLLALKPVAASQGSRTCGPSSGLCMYVCLYVCMCIYIIYTDVHMDTDDYDCHT